MEAGAIRRGSIPSVAIMAIALATNPDAGFVSQFMLLVVVAFAITAGVCGAVRIPVPGRLIAPLYRMIPGL